MNNSFEIKITGTGFTEKLVFDGRVIEKKYVATPYGWRGLDVAWDYENLPDDLVEALGDTDWSNVMYALRSDDEDITEDGEKS